MDRPVTYTGPERRAHPRLAADAPAALAASEQARLQNLRRHVPATQTTAEAPYAWAQHLESLRDRTAAALDLARPQTDTGCFS